MKTSNVHRNLFQHFRYQKKEGASSFQLLKDDCAHEHISPKVTFSDITWIVWNWLLWEYLRHRNGQTTDLGFFFSQTASIPAYHCSVNLVGRKEDSCTESQRLGPKYSVQQSHMDAIAHTKGTCKKTKNVLRYKRTSEDLHTEPYTENTLSGSIQTRRKMYLRNTTRDTRIP